MLLQMFTIIEVVGIAVIAFVVGFSVGFVVARQSPYSERALRLRIAAFITIVWAISVIASIVIAEYQTSIWIHAIMGGICGYLFGVENPITGG